MKENDRASSRKSRGDRSAAITALADEINRRMQEERAAPSLDLLVWFLKKARSRIPETFDEKIALLKALRKNGAWQLKRAGKVRYLDNLEDFTEHLEKVGEVPSPVFRIVVERLELMDPLAGGRYLSGIGALAHMARYKGPERRLIALLGGLDDHDAPFAWTSEERNLFKAVVKRHKESVEGSLGIAPVVREVPPAAAYGSAAPARETPTPTEEAKSKVRWMKGQADLIYYMGLFRKLELIDPKTTNAQIIGSFWYKSNADNPEESLRQVRRKLKKDDAHPAHDLIQKMVPMLLAELTSVDRNALLESQVLALPINERKAIYEALKASFERG